MICTGIIKLSYLEALAALVTRGGSGLSSPTPYP
jgi:hypothetical protein